MFETVTLGMIIVVLLLALVSIVCWLIRPQFVGSDPNTWEYPEGAESCADVCPNMGTCQDCDCGFP